jgi:hypothetical protein
MAPLVNTTFPHRTRETLCNNVHPEREYIKLDFPCEDIEEYCEGGFHPLRVNSIFRGRYFIRGKIGYGGCGTVWWANDIVEERQVALKIISVHYSLPTQTLRP